MEKIYLRNAAIVKKVGDKLFIASEGEGVYDEKTVIAEGTTVPRELRHRFADVVNVKDFGAVGDGVTDDTAAFSRAAQRSSKLTTDLYPGLPLAPRCTVFVPEGDYLLTETVDTGNNEVTWELAATATVLNHSLLNGKVLRPGNRTNDDHHGNLGYACTYTIRANRDLERPAEIVGITTPAELATYPDRDSVAFFVDNYGPPVLIDAATATYTSTSVDIPAPTADQIKKLRIGMVIDTKHTPKCSGMVTGWEKDGSRIYVTGWYQLHKTDGEVIPEDGIGCVINPFTKVWAQNTNILLYPDSHAEAAAGFELGLFDYQSEKDPRTSKYMWGFDAVSIGPYGGGVGFTARSANSQLHWAYAALNGAKEAAYYIGPAHYPHGVLSEQPSGYPFTHQINGVWHTLIHPDGRIQARREFVVGSVDSGPYQATLKFCSSGNVVDYDTRFFSHSGSSNPGQGSLYCEASSVFYTGHIIPTTDALSSMGTPELRWNTLYASTPTINTSDIREKTDIIDLDEALMRAWGKVNFKSFKFTNAVEKKGEEARIHFGVIAQQVQEAFASEGLDATRYALFCYDKWEAQPAVIDEKTGTVVQEAIPAGDRYGIRYSEALALECAYQRWRLSKLEEKMASIS